MRKFSWSIVFICFCQLNIIAQNTNTTDVPKDSLFEGMSVELDAIEIVAKSINQKLKEGVFAVNAVDITNRSNSLTSVSSAVNRSTGIKIREEGGVGSDYDLSINGLSGNSIRYFIDGIPLNTKGNEASLANLPVNTIERIEIYKGVVPAHLGADALGGAINIITKQKRQDFIDLSYGIGSFHTHKLDINGQHVTPKGIFIKPSVSMNYSKNDYKMKGVELWNPEASVFEKVDKRRFHDAYFYLLTQIETGVIQKKWADAFFVSLSYSSMDKELQTGSTQQIVYGKAKREQDAWNLSARYRKRDFCISGLELNASFSQTWDHSITVDTTYRKYWWDGSYIESSRNEITGRGKSLRHYKRPLTIVRTNLDYQLNEHHSFNFNYMLNRTGNNRFDKIDTDFEPSNDVLTKQILGLSYSQSFLDDKIQNLFFFKDFVNYLNIRQKDLYWISGATEMQGSSLKNYYGYGAAFRFHLMPSVSLKASFEHSVRLPLVRELLGNGTTVYPNLKLKPENSNNINMGIFGNIVLAKGHHLYYETTGFYRNVKDYIRSVISESEGTSQYENVSNVDIKGIEGELRYSYKDLLQVIANCSYQDARSKTKFYPDGSPMITYNNKIPNKPWLFSNFEVNFSKNNLFMNRSKFMAGYNYEYVHWFYLTWEGYGNLSSKSKIPEQNLHNVYISQSFRNERYNVTLQCNNVFDNTLYDNYLLQKPGRSFFCKFRIFIN